MPSDLTQPQREVLRCLLSHSMRTAAEVTRARGTGGTRNNAVILGRFVRMGTVEASTVRSIDGQKRCYSITPAGRAALEHEEAEANRKSERKEPPGTAPNT